MPLRVRRGVVKVFDSIDEMANKLQLRPAEVHKAFDEIPALQETETADHFGKTFQQISI